MTSFPPRPPPAETREAAFSVRDLRANLESRARDLETPHDLHSGFGGRPGESRPAQEC